MSRTARVVVPGFPHHVTQRGNRQADVFESNGDRHAYLRIFKQYAERHGLAVWAYCLMPNHVHFVVVPQRQESLGHAFRDAHTVYAMYFNERTGLSGHVFQGRFHSCPLDQQHLWEAVRYVERNPVRAGLATRADQYLWSSAAAHCGLRDDPLLSGDFPPHGAIEDWARWLADGDDEAATARIRRDTHTGRACGADDFLAQLEGVAGRALGPKKRGRKPKGAGRHDGGTGKAGKESR